MWPLFSGVPGRGAGRADPAVAELLQRLGIQFRVLSMRGIFGGPHAAANTPLQLGNQPFGGDGTLHHVQQRRPKAQERCTGRLLRFVASSPR
jgi:hypothetical protein